MINKLFVSKVMYLLGVCVTLRSFTIRGPLVRFHQFISYYLLSLTVIINSLCFFTTVPFGIVAIKVID